MQLSVDDPELVPVALAAVKTVATAREQLHPTQRSMLTLAQKLIIGTELDIDALAPVGAEEVAGKLRGHAGAEWVVRGMVLACLARGEVTAEDAALVEAYTEALGVEEHVVRNLRQLAEGQMALLKLDVRRRSFTGQMIRQTREEEGIFSLLRGAATRIGIIEDAETAERFEALAELPPGTLGRALHEYYVENEFPVPGKRHALPAFGVVHDLCHVLSGYGVDGPGEIEVLAFQAGFMRTDPMSTLFFAVLQSHYKVRLVAIAPGGEGRLDDPKILERMIRAFKRGSAMTVDLFDHWDYRPHLAEPIANVRASLGVPPPDPNAA
jgi:ubiquinone biosynthesis protein Coq4